MTKHELVNGLNEDLAAELKNVELKVRLEEMAAAEARHARELRRLAKGM